MKQVITFLLIVAAIIVAVSCSKNTGNPAGSDSLKISGTIADSLGAFIRGVTLNLTGTTTANTSTDASGRYTFQNLAPEGNFVVTPSSQLYDFQPPVLTFGNLGESVTEANFIAILK